MIKTITFAILHFSVAFSVCLYSDRQYRYFQRGGFGRTHRQYRRLLFSRKSVEPLREKQIREAKIVGASASVRLKFQTAFLLG